MGDFTPGSAALGGALIALGLAGMLLGAGRIAGVSGLYAGVLPGGRGDSGWRLWFLAGMAVGGLALAHLRPSTFDATAPLGLGGLVIAGLLVGVGTRLSNGCTSGHGLCGMSRLSARSIVATLTFMATGMATAVVARHLVGGG